MYVTVAPQVCLVQENGNGTIVARERTIALYNRDYSDFRSLSFAIGERLKSFRTKGIGVHA